MSISFETIGKMKTAIKTTEQRDEFHRCVVNHYIVQSCVSCLNFNPTTEICMLANQRPPARVIVFSCGEKWEKDIPF